MIFIAKDAAEDERLALAAADARERDVRRTFHKATGAVVDGTNREELSAAVLASSETLVERAVPWDIFSEKLFEINFVLTAAASAGIGLANDISRGRKRIRALTDLAPVTQRAVGIVERQGFEAVKGIADESRAAVRTILKNGIVTGAHVTEIADNLTAAIGLNARQAATLAAYQRALMDEGIGAVRRILLVGKRARKMLRERADTIARTEVMTAINAGKTEVWNELVDTGAITATIPSSAPWGISGMG